MIFTPRVLPGTYTPTTEAKPSEASVNSPCQAQPETRTKDPGAVTQTPTQPTQEESQRTAEGQRREEGPPRAPPPPEGRPGGPGGPPPPKSTASQWRGAEKPRA